MLSEEDVNRQAEQELIDEARDVVAELELRLQAVRTGHADRADAAKRLLQDASNLRLKTRSVSMAGLDALTHRLEDYLAATGRVEDRHVDDLQAFADRIGALLDGEALEPEAMPEMVRALPRKPAFEVRDVTISEIEVMLVMPQRSAARVVERELAACGYRVSTVLQPFEALQLIVATKPDMIITGMVMPGLSGVDLACAVSAMPSTRHIPVALLTGLEPNHPDLAALPMNAGLIRRGPQFGDDLAHVLQRFRIT
jgi:CheY-like chemotaxis protein